MKAKIKSPLRSPQELAEEARGLAEEAAAERDLPIDRICIRATPFGHFKVIVLDH